MVNAALTAIGAGPGIDPVAERAAAARIKRQEGVMAEEVGGRPAAQSIAVVSLYTEKIKRYGKISAEVMAGYCAKHGYKCICHKKALLTEAPASWSKIPAVLKAFQTGADWVFWLDADAIILNPEIKLESFTNSGKDIILTADLRGLQAGAMLLRNCEFSKIFLGEVWERLEECDGAGHSEQTAIRELFAARAGARGRFEILSARAFNSGIAEYDFNDFVLHLSGMGDLARYQYMKSMYSRVYQKNKPQKTAMHGGDMGDVIYSVPLFRELGISRIVLNPDSAYQTKMNSGACAVLKPLLEHQGYAVDISAGYSDDNVDYYVDIFREGPADMENNHLSVTNSEKIVSGLDLSRKYLEAEPKHIADIIISRSARYRNPDFDWMYLLEGLPSGITAAFVGVKSEYDAFCRLTNLGGRVFFYPTADLYELACVVAGARVFIGNQSSPYAVAEGLKVNRIQETCLYTPNCKAQSDNGIDVKSRNDLYGAKVKLFDWLGLPVEIPRPANKTLLYTTCHISDEYQYKRMCDWLDYYFPRLEALGASNVVLIDDGSPVKWLAELKVKYKNLALAPIQPLNDATKRGYEIPIGLATSKLSLITFPDHLGRPNENLFPGWWRSYSFGAVLAAFFNYEKFIFIESDAYLYSGRLLNWIYNTNKGFNSLYSRAMGAREPGVQVCARSEFHRITRYFKTNILNESFWWAVGLTTAQYLPEHTLPFTNELDEVKQFTIDRYGDDGCRDFPDDADGCCNLTDISLGHKYHKNEKKKIYQHQMILERLSAKSETALSL